MCPGFKMLADDCERWLAACSWSWKKKEVHGASTSSNSPVQSPAVSGKIETATLPTPPVSPRTSFTPSNSPLPSPNRPVLSSIPSSNPSPPPSPQPNLFKNEYFEVKVSQKQGLGAFALRDIPEGTVIITEKPLFRCTIMEVFFEFDNLSAEQRREYLNLHSWHGIEKHRVLAIFKTNQFETSDGKCGIFLKSSRFNHACHPYSNCTYRWDDKQQLLITKSLYKIPAGDEITISYGSNAGSYMYQNYGFYCDCAACPEPADAEANAKMLAGSSY